MFEDYLRAVPKNPLLSKNSDLGDLGTNTAQTNKTSQATPLVVSNQNIPADLKVLITSLPALEMPSAGGSSIPNLEHLLATLKQQTENQEYQQKLQMLQNAGNITSAKNADALMIMDKIFNTVAQGSLCTQTGIVMGYLLAAREAGLPVEEYLAKQNITVTPELQAMLDIAEAEIEKAPANASLDTIVSNILASAGEAAQVTFTPEDLEKFSSEISSELMEVHTSGEEAREAHQGEVDSAQAQQTTAENNRTQAENDLNSAKDAEQSAKDSLQTLKNEREPLKTKLDNAQTAYDKALAAEKEPQDKFDQAQANLNNAVADQSAAAQNVTDAELALKEFDEANGDPENLTEAQKAERQKLTENLDAAKEKKNTADSQVTAMDTALTNAQTALNDAKTVTASMQTELTNAQNNLNAKDLEIASAETALAQAEAATKAAETVLAQKTQALSDAELAVLAATTAQNDAAMAAINKAFGEYVDACVAMGLMEAEKRQEEERLQKQDDEKKQLAEDIERYIKKMNLTIKTPAEQLAEVLTALLDSQAAFLDMMGKSNSDQKEIEQEIYQNKTI